MRKNSVRKWIHAIIDLLPLFVIPIFAIAVRSDNNYSNNLSIDVPHTELVNFNQLRSTKNGELNFSGLYSYGGNETLNLVYGDKYYVCFDFQITNYINDFGNVNMRCRLGNPSYAEFSLPFVVTNGALNRFSGISTLTYYFNNYSSSYFMSYDSHELQTRYDNFMIVDLTHMFGAGNEPTIAQFEQWYSNDYYDYTLGHKELLNVGTTTYNDTDIGSQFVYSLYNTTDKYFNMGNIFGVDGFYNWLNTNLFNGGAPLMIKTIWTIIVYEFIMDLMFLFYDIFMFIMDWIKALLGRAIDKTSGGAC